MCSVAILDLRGSVRSFVTVAIQVAWVWQLARFIGNWSSQCSLGGRRDVCKILSEGAWR